MLVRYAGYDKHERARHVSEPRATLALRLFRQGADTLQIANHMRIEEWEVVWLIHRARKEEK